jgi:putative FmdB family regulatory protein
MPTYEYECGQCGVFDVFQSITAEKLKNCPECGSPVRRRIGTGAGIVFKGSGFYETDFKNKKGAKPDSKPGPKKDAASPSDGGKKTPDTKGAAGESRGAKKDD